jgi:hypothetical protein
MKIDGRCHCGHVTFEAEADPETTTICNCTDCQTMSGAPLRAVIITRPGTFVLLSGKPTEYRTAPTNVRSWESNGLSADIAFGPFMTPERTLREIAVPTSCPMLPRDSNSPLTSVALAAIGELATEAGE